MKKTWWKESVIYQIYPRSFNDSNGDGVGDLRGIIEKLDYLQELGIDIVWLSPIYQSPNDDNGYDISDYYGIMDEFGTMADFDELLAGIHQRGMKLLMDLVVNHSSDEHAWFEASRQSKDNPYRDYYFWRPGKNGGPPNNWQSFFGGSAWRYDPLTEEYFLHLFTKKQPDLNWENPRVRQDIYRMMRFWLDKGVDGFRMDVIPLISKRLDFADVDHDDFGRIVEEVYANGPRVHEFLQEMHEEVLRHYDIMTVGEGPGIGTVEAPLYVGEGRRELNMIFHFGHMFIDMGKGGRLDVVPFDLVAFKRIFTDWHHAMGEHSWINVYLDNHDFSRMVSRFGNDGKYRVASAKLLALLLLTMRGTPCIYQGSEIGMTNVAFPSLDDYRDVEIRNAIDKCRAEGGDEEALLRAIQHAGRDNARTPIQWDASPQAGFTTAPEPWIKVNPNYPEINAAAVVADPNSIYYTYRDLLALRKQHPTLIYGDYRIVAAEHPQLFAYYRFAEAGEYFVALHFGEAAALNFPRPEGEGWDLLWGNELRPADLFGPLRAWEARLYCRRKG
ncbi:MAG: alpha-glucosidase [Bacteroidota bacterium]